MGWPILLVDSLPLLKADEPVISTEQTYELMYCLHNLCDNTKNRNKSSPLESETAVAAFTAKESEIRLALTNNLARAVIHEGSVAMYHHNQVMVQPHLNQVTVHHHNQVTVHRLNQDMEQHHHIKVMGQHHPAQLMGLHQVSQDMEHHNLVMVHNLVMQEVMELLQQVAIMHLLVVTILNR